MSGTAARAGRFDFALRENIARDDLGALGKLQRYADEFGRTIDWGAVLERDCFGCSSAIHNPMIRGTTPRRAPREEEGPYFPVEELKHKLKSYARGGTRKKAKTH